MAKSNRSPDHKVNNLQIIYSERRKLFTKRYLTKKGLRLVANKSLTEKEADIKYGKNRYCTNENAKPVKTISHIFRIRFK